MSGNALRTRAFDLLSRRDHSRWELARKLRQKGAAPDEIEPLLEELEAFGYLDDERFCRNFIRYRSQKAWGLSRYRQELQSRGVSSDLVSRILEDSEEISDQTQILKLERLIGREVERGKEKQKIVAAMLRRGFASQRVRAAWDRVNLQSQ